MASLAMLQDGVDFYRTHPQGYAHKLWI